MVLYTKLVPYIIYLTPPIQGNMHHLHGCNSARDVLEMLERVNGALLHLFFGDSLLARK